MTKGGGRVKNPENLMTSFMNAAKLRKFARKNVPVLYLLFMDIFSVPVFQVVRFPNDPCVISGGEKNGTCYTA